MYHCTRYTKYDSGRRNNTFCTFLTPNLTRAFGQIVLFILYPQPCALINEISIAQDTSLTEQAGRTTHSKLIKHMRANLLNNIIPIVTISERIFKVEFSSIIKKTILIHVSSQNFISEIVNSHEFH